MYIQHINTKEVPTLTVPEGVPVTNYQTERVGLLYPVYIYGTG